VDKIFKGAKPAELPIEQPMKFDFVINLRAAKAIGLAIPETFLLRAQALASAAGHPKRQRFRAGLRGEPVVRHWRA
jgi:hypothetical protein